MIKCDSVTIKYDGFTAVKNASFSVEKGEWFFIVGENGCGKSTLVKALLGLERADEGNITRDKNIRAGYVAQQMGISKDFPANAIEIVLSGHVKKAGLFYKKEHRKNAEEKIKLLGIGDIKKACFSELSGGQRQRVLLARALCGAENLLVLDEPLTGLDEETCEKLFTELEKLHKNGMTIIMVSHHMETVKKYADKVLSFGEENIMVESGKEFAERNGTK